ncbi:protein CBFA2T3 isoform X2 [Dermochelys coriacea]|uniref:protein CBFA2T3 isoform X2 n=1 Tax=Dermochelys coriacea TaxID=27794 RepID=UPI0018E811A2|nr:protein CBFA2T3 isoform X2 [Dermochelys coriacea]
MAPGEGAPGELAKDITGPRCTGTRERSGALTVYMSSAEKKKAATMPDSPADVKTQSRSTPPNMPPPPPAVTQGATRHPSFTPNTNQEAGPPTFLPRGRFHGCLKWSMVCLLMNGSSHSPSAINGAPSTPNGFSNGPATSSTASLSTHQLPPACGARQLSKLKRFLTTLQQFGNDISPEIGERVRTLVLGLVNSTLTIEEFHSKLQEATNFPLRPFVIPFLKANLPLLQRELLHCARMAKQTPAQYLAQHEQLLLDANASSPIDSSELLLEVTETGKRRTPDRTKENGLDRDPLHPEHLSKRPCTMSPAQRYSPSNGLPHPTPPPPPPQHYRLEDMAMAHHYRDTYRHPDPRELRERHRQVAVHGSRQEEVIDHRLTDREWAEEWKHLNNLLNCIMDMVEKTRRSLTVLRRCQEADREELNHWIRRYSDAEDMKKGTNPPPRPHNSSSNSEAPPLDTHREFVPRPLSGYMPEEIWRKAEAVNEVKRQAMSELQKAVSDAERKAHELITTERAKMERALAEAKRQASEDALTVINQQEDSSEVEASSPHCAVLARSCWNCGRKASETCSGCNTARYCGSFCQHKDWEKHHHVCGQTLQGLQTSAGAAPSSGVGLGVGSAQPDVGAVSTSITSVATMAASPSETGSAAASRSGTPATPAPLETASR